MNLKTIQSARETLAAAIEAKAKADAELAASERAHFATRNLVDSALAEVNQYIEADRAIADERAQAVKAAARGSASRVMEPTRNLLEVVARRAEAEHRLSAARQAMNELGEEVRAARASADAAAGAVLAAANAVAGVEAEKIAADIEQLEMMALGLRMQLGGGCVSSPLILLPVYGEATRRVLAGNDETVIGMTNTPEWRAAAAFGKRWQTHVKDLARDPDAVFVELPE